MQTHSTQTPSSAPVAGTPPPSQSSPALAQRAPLLSPSTQPSRPVTGANPLVPLTDANRLTGCSRLTRRHSRHRPAAVGRLTYVKDGQELEITEDEVPQEASKPLAQPFACDSVAHARLRNRPPLSPAGPRVLGRGHRRRRSWRRRPLAARPNKAVARLRLRRRRRRRRRCVCSFVRPPAQRASDPEG